MVRELGKLHEVVRVDRGGHVESGVVPGAQLTGVGKTPALVPGRGGVAGAARQESAYNNNTLVVKSVSAQGTCLVFSHHPRIERVRISRAAGGRNPKAGGPGCCRRRRESGSEIRGRIAERDSDGDKSSEPLTDKNVKEAPH